MRRLDDVVKVAGNRVELGDVEAALAKDDTLVAAAVRRCSRSRSAAPARRSS
ncbi:hypothetical protein BH23ACT2_BH23ACT2_24690 [soil metagenome]